MIEILDPGPLCTVQDHGRPGWAYLGVGRSGAADRRAHDLANRLVGNPPAAATLETTFGGLRIRFRQAAYVAVTGADCIVGVDHGANGAHHQPVAILAGSVLTLGPPRSGLRNYVAVRGGVDTAPELGSRSTDLLSGLGPAPLAVGDLLAIGATQSAVVPTEHSPRRHDDTGPIRLWPGPRFDWFDAAAFDSLRSSPFRVLPTSNRIGVRLTGPALGRVVTHELPSEGIVEGAMQVPNDGQPLIFLADHPVTGGYPVIAVVEPDDLHRVAQARPGDMLQFRWHRQANSRDLIG